MATRNKIKCLQSAGNTGVGTCFLDIKNIVGAILAPKGYEFDVTTPLTTLMAAMLNSSKSQRLFPIFDFENTTDSSEDKTVQTTGTGAKHPVREGFNDWSFMYVAGGLSLHKNLRKFNGGAYDFYFIDAQNRLIGIPGSSATKLRAIPSTGGFFWANPWKVNDGSKIAEYLLQFVFAVKYSNDLLEVIELDFDAPTELYGLEDVDLSGAGDATPGTYDILAETASVKTNMGDRYPTQLASTSMWTAKNPATGNAITISAVTWDADTERFKIALLVSDADYVAAANIEINLVAPAVLDAAGIYGFESTGSVTIVKN